ncbi:MAG: HAD-IA family hydrolase [Actinomycetota bacterium]|nr:HAD-IA family hydrolase [Actinomycetota bacterium]
MDKRKPHERQTPLTGIACVLFDLDGTLIDTIDLIYRSFDYAVKKVLGLSLPRKRLLHNIGRPLRTQMEYFSPAKVETLMAAYNEDNLAKHDANVKAYPYAAATLRWLKLETARKVAIVTSKKRDLALRGLEITGLAEYIDVVVAMEDTARHKPEPDPVREALKRLRCRPQAAVFIGDSPFDLAAGRAAGTYIGAAYWGPFDPEELHAFNADIDLGDLSELRRWL